MKDSRFQFQPWYVKAWRWLRWKSLFTLLAIICIARWLATGAKPLVVDSGLYCHRFSRRWTLRHIVSLHRGRADARMGNYVTSEELIASLGGR